MPSRVRPLGSSERARGGRSGGASAARARRRRSGEGLGRGRGRTELVRACEAALRVGECRGPARDATPCGWGERPPACENTAERSGESATRRRDSFVTRLPSRSLIRPRFPRRLRLSRTRGLARSHAHALDDVIGDAPRFERLGAPRIARVFARPARRPPPPRWLEKAIRRAFSPRGTPGRRRSSSSRVRRRPARLGRRLLVLPRAFRPRRVPVRHDAPRRVSAGGHLPDVRRQARGGVPPHRPRRRVRRGRVPREQSQGRGLLPPVVHRRPRGEGGAQRRHPRRVRHDAPKRRRGRRGPRPPRARRVPRAVRVRRRQGVGRTVRARPGRHARGERPHDRRVRRVPGARRQGGHRRLRALLRRARREPEAYAVRCATAAAEAGASHVVLCETNGGQLPWACEAATRDVVEALREKGLLERCGVGAHAHNDARRWRWRVRSRGSGAARGWCRGA